MPIKQPTLVNIDDYCFESPEEKNEFINNRDRYLKSNFFHHSRFTKVKPPKEEDFVTYKELKNCPNESIANYLSQLIVIKFNGGRGLSLGLEQSKARVIVSNGMTFLDIVVRQIEYLNDTYKVSIPLIMMNSFITHEDTIRLTKKYEGRNISIHHFKQSRYPRLRKDTLNPSSAQPSKFTPAEWNPPGSGDVYNSFARSGLLDKFISEGKKIAFISNLENLGAIPGRTEFKLLNYMATNPTQDYLVEVAERISTDFQGGLIIREDLREREGEGIGLLELSQIPDDKVGLFSGKNYKYWNTNSIWLRLSEWKEKVQNNSLDLGIILKSSPIPETLQIEYPAATVFHSFKNPKAIIVPRYRYWDIKSTAALFLLQSNLYSIDPSTCQVIFNEKRPYETIPLVRFGETFQKFKDYLKRFKEIPDITELDHLTVSGDVYFGTAVTLRGTVIIVANHGERIDIPDGAILHNNVISGSLTITDH